MPASKDLQSFKLLIWKIVRNLLATTEIVLAHVSAINWDQPRQKLVKLLYTETALQERDMNETHSSTSESMVFML